MQAYALYRKKANGKAMRWFRRQGKKGLTYDQMAVFLLKQAAEVITSTSQTLKEQFDAGEQSKLPKIRDELLYFFVFALDYWRQKDPSRTQEQNRTFGRIFGTHLNAMFGDDLEGQAMWDTLQERFIAYGEIVNERKGDSAKFMGFGMKLSEYCEIANPVLLLLAPKLFTEALQVVSAMEAQNRRSE